MDQENFYDIITRYLDGSASREEAEILLDWLKADKQNMKMFIDLKDLWLKTGTFNKEDKETEAALLRFKKRVEYTYSSPNQRRITWMKYGNIAAVLIIAILTGVLLFHRNNTNEDLRNSFTETIIPLGQKGQVVLADGTKISLNSGSKLRYPSNFNGTSREVFLEGEAYFDVAHNEEKPFLVHSGKLTVKVLGTVFNLKAYSGENKIETTLISGSVNDHGAEQGVGGPHAQRRGTAGPSELRGPMNGRCTGDLR
jgi:ferric-dicitrate binding protein FerR (iron transport regulator)